MAQKEVQVCHNTHVQLADFKWLYHTQYDTNNKLLNNKGHV